MHPLYGVTTEMVSNRGTLNQKLSTFDKRPTTRIVFQDGEPASTYAEAVNQIRAHSYVMGELLDSTALEQISVQDNRARAQEYVSAFGNKVDIWEIGNDLNGEWVGTPADTNARAEAAFSVVKGAGGWGADGAVGWGASAPSA